MLIVKVAVENTTYNFDMAYDYMVPIELESKVKPGCRVLVMFGMSKYKRQGLILEVVNNINNSLLPEKKIKPIVSILDEEPILNRENLNLISFMKSRYFCTYFEAAKLMYPTGLNYSNTEFYKFNKEYNSCELINLSPNQVKIIDLIKKSKNKIKKDKLEKVASIADINYLEMKNIIKKDFDNVRKISDKMVKMVKISSNKSNVKLTTKQKLVYDFLTTKGKASIKEVCYFTGVGISVIERMHKNGIIDYFNETKYRIPYHKKSSNKFEVNLSNEQDTAFREIYEEYKKKKPKVHLLYGITGSGKTSVFLKLIDKVNKNGENIILMVPEIALTTQMISLFKTQYGDNVAVFHSGLSVGERLDEWRRVKTGKASIAIGTRSAIFAPFENIGLIIIDEEQEGSYKSSKNPRYNTIDIAKYRCLNNNALLLLSSATPSIESYYMANHGKYGLSKISTRYGDAMLPKVKIIDMNSELLNGNDTAFSNYLLCKLKENIENKFQSILLLNRRGYHTFASCRSCMKVITCPNCSISMTYHNVNNKLMCHYCGYSVEFTDECPNCKQNHVRYSGFGTQKIEHDLKLYIPNAKVLRMDTDTTMTKYSHFDKLKSFSEGKYDILIGTQMVAKGLDFPNVTLVGVVLADQILYSDDFRSYEHAFDLLTQVVGRGGRGKNKGQAVIQTYTPENPIIRLAASQNYDKFYKSEISIRKAMLYPPFVDICFIGFVGKDEGITEKAAKTFLGNLSKVAESDYKEQPMRVIGPSPSAVYKVNNKYRFKIIIKCKNNSRFRDMISKLLIEFSKEKQFKKVGVFVDINPDSMV